MPAFACVCVQPPVLWPVLAAAVFVVVVAVGVVVALVVGIHDDISGHATSGNRCSAALEELRDDSAFDVAVVAQAELFFDRVERWRSGRDRTLKPLCYAVVATTTASCDALAGLSLHLASALQAQLNKLAGVEDDPCSPLRLDSMVDVANNDLCASYPEKLNRGANAAAGRQQRSSAASVVVVGQPTVAGLPGAVPFTLHSLCDQTAAPVASNVYVLPVCLPDGSGAAAVTDHDPVDASKRFKQQLRAELQPPRLPPSVDLDALIARVGEVAVLVGDPGDDVDCTRAPLSPSPECFHQSRLTRALARFGAAAK